MSTGIFLWTADANLQTGQAAETRLEAEAAGGGRSAWWPGCGRRGGGVKGMTTPSAILVGDTSAFSLRFKAAVVE